MNVPSKAGLAVLAAALLASAPAIADGPRGHARIGAHRGAPVVAAHGHGHPRGGVRFGVYVGAPLVWGSYYRPWRYYDPWPHYAPYYPPVITVPASPPIYIERGLAVEPAAPAAPQPGYWYYCSDAQAYYPYVKECPGGWQRVSPLPPQG